MRTIAKRVWLYTLLFLSIPTITLAQDESRSNSLFQAINDGFTWFVDNIVFGILFWDAGTGYLFKTLFGVEIGIPLIVLWLIVGGVFFTFRMGFINVRAFKHSLDVVRGKYDDAEDEGEVSHFQALATALSATVGLGNIAGVAIAVSLGGPGAVFWMTVGGFFGMSSKFVECTLGQKYRVVQPDGTISGGPMRYLSEGLRRLKYGAFGRVLAIAFSIFCIMGALGGANMFQANQSYGAVSRVFPFIPSWLYGLILATLVGLVLVGGVRRIGQVAGTIVPLMCALYVVASLFILLTNFTEIPGAFWVIISSAFQPEAIEGGILGVLIQGFRRSAFSNEAGLGSAAIAHSAAGRYRCPPRTLYRYYCCLQYDGFSHCNYRCLQQPRLRRIERGWCWGRTDGGGFRKFDFLVSGNLGDRGLFLCFFDNDLLELLRRTLLGLPHGRPGYDYL